MSIYICILNRLDPTIQGVASSLTKVKEIIEREKPEGNDFMIEEWDLDGSFVRYFRAMDEIETELHVDRLAGSIESQLEARGIDPSTLVVTGREMKFPEGGPVVVEEEVATFQKVYTEPGTVEHITLRGHIEVKEKKDG